MNDHERTADEADQRRIRAWNATRHHYPSDQSVPALVSAQASATPERLALGGQGVTMTYTQVDAAAGAVARLLAALGVARDSLVAIALPRSPALAAAALGVLYAGGAYVPIDPGYPADRIRFILEDAAPAVVVTDVATHPLLPAGPWRVVRVDDRMPSDGAGRWDRFDSGADDLAYVIYTSGSTGRPKGVEITHGSLMNLVAWHDRVFSVTEEDRATQYASPGFDAAVWEIWPYLAAGASVHFVDDATRLDPERLRDWLVASAITIGFVPTPMAERLLALDWPGDSCLRLLLTGGDTLHLYPRPGLPFTLVNNYGPTESAVVATSGIIPWATGADTLPPIGRPIDNTEIHILDERLRPVPIGEIGELCIAGAGLARGYRNQPELTAERFVQNPFEPKVRLYRTGDSARFLADGRIAFHGRIDEQVKVRGVRIEPDEVVAALTALPDVAASAVAVRDDGHGDRVLVAWVVPAPGARPLPSTLRAALGATLPDAMIPSLFVEVGALPLSANGKVDRAALPAPDQASTLRDEEVVAPRSVVEERLVKIVGPILGVETVGVTDNFFLLGGHSLLGTQLVARIHEAFEVALPLRTVFEHPTVTGLAAEVERAILARMAEDGETALERAA